MKFFDGYINQKVALFDDFRKEMCPFNYLLKLTDRHDINVEVKGGSVFFNPEVIIITCPRSPEQEYVNHNTNEVYEDIE